MPTVARFEGEGAIGRRSASVELARLGDRAARELGAADPGGKAEVVLDPARRPGLAAERGALDDEGVEPFGGAVDRGREACRAGADDQQVDLLAGRELEPDPESAEHLAGGRAIQLSSARQPHERQLAPPGGAASSQVYGSRFARANSSIRIVGSESCGPTISSRPLHALCSASRREMKVVSKRSLSGRPR